MATYHVLLPILVFFGVGAILITTFVVVDTTAPMEPATAGTSTVTVTTVTTVPVPTTTPAPVCPSSTTIFTNITGSPLLTENGWFIVESFYDYTNTLVFASLPAFSYPTPPTPPTTVTAAALYMGDLLVTVNGVDALFSVNSGIRGMLTTTNMKGFGLSGGFLYGQLNNAALVKINPMSGTMYTSIPFAYSIHSIAVNPITNNAFVLLATTGEIVRINLNTGTTSPTCISTSALTSIAFDSLGRMWGAQSGNEFILRYPNEPI